MQTTLRLNEALYRRAKAEAAKQGVTMTRFVEEGLQLRLKQRPVNTPVELAVFDNGEPFDYSPEELKRLGQESDWGGPG